MENRTEFKQNVDSPYTYMYIEENNQKYIAVKSPYFDYMHYADIMHINDFECNIYYSHFDFQMYATIEFEYCFFLENGFCVPKRYM
jgi:hypothetical protein